MLSAHLPFLTSHAVVLASQSPRRLEILGKLGLTVSVDPSRFDETLEKAQFPGAAGAPMISPAQDPCPLARLFLAPRRRMPGAEVSEARLA